MNDERVRQVLVLVVGQFQLLAIQRRLLVGVVSRRRRQILAIFDVLIVAILLHGVLLLFRRVLVQRHVRLFDAHDRLVQ